MFCTGIYTVKKIDSFAFCDIRAVIYFLRADTSLVWLPSAQRQPPVLRPSCIYVVIITKGDLDQIVCLIYKECSLPSGSKSYKRLKQIKNVECWYKISNHLVKTESKRKPETHKKRLDFCGSMDKKRLDFILLFWKMSYWAALDSTES